MKRLLTLALAALLSVSAVPASSICESPLVLLGYQAAWNELSSQIDNPTSGPEDGVLVIDFIMDGQSQAWWFDVALPGDETWQYHITFPSTITVVEVKVCEEPGQGVVEAPDPVANNVKKEKH